MNAMVKDELTIREMISERLDKVKRHGPAFLFMLVVVMMIYASSVLVKPGWLTYLLSAGAMVVIAVTALARLDDISPDQCSSRWQVRRAGLIMVGAASIGIGIEPVTILAFKGMPMEDFPSWKEVMIRAGFALTWITTPHMPPWWRYISGEFKTVDDARKAAAAVDISGIYDTKEHPVYVSPEMTDKIIKVEKTRNPESRL